MNSYSNIARHYDLLMTSGYYDYEALSHDLQQVIGTGDRVLEVGVGTGLMADKLLSHRPDIAFTGIDNTEAMLEQARRRLDGRVDLHLQDVATFEADQPYDLVFSCGGVWYLIDDGSEQLQLCSHIPDPDTNRRAFENVLRLLRPGGALVLSIQGVHRDFEQRLDDQVVYRQHIRWDGDIFHKEYVFEEGEKRASQHCTYRILRDRDMQAFFAEVNLRMADSPLQQFRSFASIGHEQGATASVVAARDTLDDK